MKENGSEVFYEILGKERGTKELYHAEDEKDLRGRAFLVVLGLGGCAEIADENGKAGSSVSEDERFEAYTREVFCSEVSANAVSLHYTLKYPQEYGIESAPAVYGTVVTDEQAVKAGVENMEKALITFEKNKLSVENQITYDVLQSYLDSAERSAEYLWYDEPLGTVSGVQTQLPVVLSEYRFYEKRMLIHTWI